jgi:hydrogenase assembly chaperone HypC/HupF
MCVAIPGKVVAIGLDGADVEVRGRKRRVSTLLLTDVHVGDYVLISNGMIVERLSADEALERDAVFAAMLEAIDDTA